MEGARRWQRKGVVMVDEPVEVLWALGEAPWRDLRPDIAAAGRVTAVSAHSVHLRCDSELAIRQLTGVYQVKNEALRPLFDEVKRLEAGFAGGVTFEHVRREYNRQADALANEALDSSS